MDLVASRKGSVDWNIAFFGETRQKCRRFPQGKRGLKFETHNMVGEILKSLPAREAWIEIMWNGLKVNCLRVASRKGSVDWN